MAAENLSFDRTDQGDLAFALAGDWKDYELWFAWRPEADCLQLCLSIDLQASKAARAGAFDRLHPNRAQIVANSDVLMAYGQSVAAERASSQSSLFATDSDAARPRLSRAAARDQDTA